MASHARIGRASFAQELNRVGRDENGQTTSVGGGSGLPSTLDPELVLNVIRELAHGGMIMLIATREMGFARP